MLNRAYIFDIPEFAQNDELLMMTCSEGCKRRIRVKDILAHEVACKQVFQRKRKVFESKYQRMSLEQIQLAKKGEIKDKEYNRLRIERLSRWKVQSKALWD